MDVHEMHTNRESLAEENFTPGVKVAKLHSSSVPMF